MVWDITIPTNRQEENMCLEDKSMGKMEIGKYQRVGVAWGHPRPIWHLYMIYFLFSIPQISQDNFSYAGCYENITTIWIR